MTGKGIGSMTQGRRWKAAELALEPSLGPRSVLLHYFHTGGLVVQFSFGFSARTDPYLQKSPTRSSRQPVPGSVFSRYESI